MIAPSTLLDTARALATEAGQLIRDGRHGAHIEGTKSSSVDIVTQMDTASERLLRERLAQWRPGDAVHGEEGEDSSGNSGVTWVVDPIDGTVNYLYGIPHFGVSVAAVTGVPTPGSWRLEAGAVFDAQGRLWSAARGEGAWCDGVPLGAQEGPDLAHTLLATGFQYQPHRRRVQGEIVARMLPQVRDIRRLGSAAIDLCHAAAGLVDAYYEHGLHAWDFAAGELIATEAGLRVAGIDGGPADERLLIAASPGRWNDVRDALVKAGADTTWARADA
ncbi:inositol monophosphatase family protein [Demequina globuliformis]|uniref:inositol monophosphatase family protein n=1 Tax=Demequina globuliformis TaxID=676202 RepID=UPI000783C5EB|nr:inositol monophosphatase family protein [Demequina globuliformis]